MPAGHFTEVPLPTESAQTGIHAAQVIGENERRAAAVGAMHQHDRQVRQVNARIERGDFRVVPFGDVAEINVGERVAVQFEFRIARQIVDDGHAAGDDWECAGFFPAPWPGLHRSSARRKRRNPRSG